MRKLLCHPERSEGPSEHSRRADEIVRTGRNRMRDPSPSEPALSEHRESNARLEMTPRRPVCAGVTEEEIDA